MDWQALYELYMDDLTPAQQERVSDTRFLHMANEALRDLTQDAKFNEESLLGQTVVGQEFYDGYGRMVEVHSFRVGPTWDESGEPTFEGYELCDGRGTFQLSVRSRAARIPKSELGVS